MNILKRALKFLTANYLVVAIADGKTTEHYAKDWDEAINVMSSYGVSANCGVYERFLGITALAPKAVRWNA